VTFNGTGAQTIAAVNYNNLTISGNKNSNAITLASGTIGVAGTFSNTATNVSSWITTGNTVNYNGTGAQTILAINYNNLTSSSTGARTLASSGTIGIAGTFTPGTNSYTITGSTIDSNGTGVQTIASFNYYNLNISNTAAAVTASSPRDGRHNWRTFAYRNVAFKDLAYQGQLQEVKPSFAGYEKEMALEFELLKEFARDARHYGDNPYDYLQWIADNTNRPGYDAKGATVRAILQGVDSALSLIKTVTDDTIKIRNDLLRLINDLPDVLKKEIKPWVDEVSGKFDRFIRLTYDPAFKALSASYAVIGDGLKDQQAQTKGVMNRLKRPGRYLSEIKELTDDDRKEDLSTLSDLLGESWDNELPDVTGEIDKIYDAVVMTPEEVQPRLVSIPTPPGKYTVPAVWEEPEKEKITTPFVEKETWQRKK